MRRARYRVSLLVVIGVLQSSLGFALQQSGDATPPDRLSKREVQSEHSKALHALNRLTFGPRPGEVEAVEAMGLHNWIEQQLHPQMIDDSDLSHWVGDYKTQFMSPEQMMMNFPNGSIIRQALKGAIPVPADEPVHTVWTSQMAIMQERENRSEKAPPNSVQPAHSATNIEEIIGLPAAARYHALLNAPPLTDIQLLRPLTPARLTALTSGMTLEQQETVGALLRPEQVVIGEAQSVRLLKDIYSQRQLQRVMTEFWMNHFNLYSKKNQIEPYYISQFEQTVIAPHALGSFEDLLVSVAKSPAMLIYLDNARSIGPDSLAAQRRMRPGFQTVHPSLEGINENYGRELMELHTIGVNGGYTQQDVIEAAKVLTGWTVTPMRQGGGFRFNTAQHEPGDKIVLGHTIPDGGENEGIEMLHVLATSPATARFISLKLAVRFVSDHPSSNLINCMVKTFLSTGGDIGRVLQTMIDSDEFWSATDSGNKVKTPLDYVVSSVRATNATVSDASGLLSSLNHMGMPLTGTQEPNGYAMTNDAWNSTSELVSRMNFALDLTSNRIPGVTVSVRDMLGAGADELSTVQQTSQLEKTLLNGPADRSLSLTLKQMSRARATPPVTTSVAESGDKQPQDRSLSPMKHPSALASASVAAGMIIGSPQFQQR